jgi:uncharacterized protein YbbK (DUF523 family)
MMVGVSACLAGKRCRYDGSARPNEQVMALVEKGGAFAFCPECLAGLKIPRTPSEIIGGEGADVLMGMAKVVSKDGTDRTEEFLLAAKKTLEICLEKNISEVWLKSKSPSCGVLRIYDGTFSGALRHGCGVTAAYLSQNGIKTIEID